MVQEFEHGSESRNRIEHSQRTIDKMILVIRMTQIAFQEMIDGSKDHGMIRDILMYLTNIFQNQIDLFIRSPS